MKSLNNRYTAVYSNTHETFADIVFCALVVLVLFVMALAIEVSQRVRAKVVPFVDVTTTKIVEDKAPPLPLETAESSLRSQFSEAEFNAMLQQTQFRISEIRQQLQSKIDSQKEELNLQRERIRQLRTQIANQEAIAKNSKGIACEPHFANATGPSKLKCQGWWEQVEFGRQPMKEFVIEIANGKLRGSGADIIGDFVLRGRMDNDEIVIQKTYFGRHSVDYLGKKHGEGLYYGQWSQRGIGSGPWQIRVRPIPKGVDPATAPCNLVQLTSR